MFKKFTKPFKKDPFLKECAKRYAQLRKKTTITPPKKILGTESESRTAFSGTGKRRSIPIDNALKKISESR